VQNATLKVKRGVSISLKQEGILCLIEKLKQVFGNDFVALALFGSLARGEVEEAGDIDLFCIIDNLPDSAYRKTKLLHQIAVQCIKRRLSIIAKTRKEFISHFSSLYLDLGLDAIIIYDSDDFLAQKLQRIRQIIEEAGLKREQIGKDFYWDWDVSPKARWEITWDGYHELAG
ncbi:nucleotidyltransferase domain-containing protein, partial [Candidatus Aerophobetes bacterium]|nr:nucleotidyltransferase domain-containing protein [Candidatus Aerophobetes bacterium]